MSMDLLQPPLLQHATPFEPLHSVLSTCSKTLQVISRKTAGWPFEAVRTAESAETTEAKLDFRDSLHHIPNSSDVWRLLELYSTNRFLLASPYLTQDHLLDLPTFTKQEQLMAKALTVMAPVRADYAVSPYAEAFNWATVIDALRLLVRQEGLVWHRQAFHSIAFRSLLAPAADYARLSEMDERAHAEATSSGGLLKYWFGEPDGNRRNIATCESSRHRARF